MDKKKRTRELIVFAVIVLALLAGKLVHDPSAVHCGHHDGEHHCGGHHCH